MEQAIPENESMEEETSNLIYDLAAGPDFRLGEQGVAFAAHQQGLLRSMDGGQTWEDALADVGLPEPLPVICLEAAFNGHIFAGAPGGIFRSKDGGQTWQATLLPSPPPTVSALAVSPNYLEDETVFAGTMEDGVFISRDGGARWVTWNFGFLDLNVLCLAVSPNHVQDETIFAGTETGIFRSTNGGRAWREVEMPFGFGAVISLAIPKTFAEDATLFAGTDEHGLWVSRDGGESWQPAGAVDEPVNAILLAGSEILAVTGSALLRSDDGGATWSTAWAAEAEGKEISTVLAADSYAPGTILLAGFVDGTIETITLA